MNLIKTLVMMVTFGMSSLALAEGGADRIFARMEAARQTSVSTNQLAQQKKDQAPVAAEIHKQAKHESC
ncbi:MULTISPECIES: co-regulatory protein PtrA N-terminal domain-containing protein [Pseudomonas]|uniref:Co-regulatory protein PtrA N-terminal domain-containing protein n=1 Tax=Pseudomonas sp. Hg7Tf TaxID=3236988 RepID=A0AB39HYS1_9PSED|nr:MULTISPECIES: co-regulatory protein PtrA N-terminal domain-containing protein [Pseudomonas]MDH2559834.1 co-regulatory protein PtrA N-terminal domain-containing protein [Pseudomonas sp. Hg5Tf]MDN7142183.1 hypothetical protein [Pseudomonas sp. JQ170]WRO76911.1 co-regulatory protein PtrA N-terminal domain-containing protein [Pseudomonas sp. 170C]